MNYYQNFRHILLQSAEAKRDMAEDEALLKILKDLVLHTVALFRNGGRLLLCGNGGSAADAQHLAAELSGRFYIDRPPLPVEALHANGSYLTAVANDFGYETVFERAVQAQGRAGDMLWAFSTSGKSPNILRALTAARRLGMTTAGFTGSGGGAMPPLCDLLLRAPSDDTPRIQECHILLGHIACEYIERELFARD